MVSSLLVSVGHLVYSCFYPILSVIFFNIRSHYDILYDWNRMYVLHIIIAHTYIHTKSSQQGLQQRKICHGWFMNAQLYTHTTGSHAITQGMSVCDNRHGHIFSMYYDNHVQSLCKQCRLVPSIRSMTYFWKYCHYNDYNY